MVIDKEASPVDQASLEIEIALADKYVRFRSVKERKQEREKDTKKKDPVLSIPPSPCSRRAVRLKTFP